MEPWITTYSGTRYSFLAPLPEEVHLKDIAHSLSLQCRYNGHCSKFYSVAEHSINVAEDILDTEDDPFLAFQGLLHDAPEAYITDLVRPLKWELGESYRSLEKLSEQAIAVKFGLPQPLDPRIKAYDNQWLFNEAAQLILEDISFWHGYVEPKDVVISNYTPEEAEAKFIDMFYFLRDESELF